METVPYQGNTLRRWRVGSSTFLALPEKGARLMNWSLTLGDGTVRDVIHWPENADLGDISKVRGGNPILFPFCGRSFDAGDIHFWRDSAGTRRPMPIHGVARQGEFKTVRMDAAGFAAQFVPAEEARLAYPYDYEFTVSYLFEPHGLACEFSLKNLGPEPIPWSAGHHFYFTVPWNEGTKRGDLLIRIPAGKRLRQDFSKGNLIPGPALAEIESLGNPGLIDTFHTALRSPEAVVGEKGKPGDIVVRMGASKSSPPDATFVTWTAADDAPFYCVEPWMGPPNSTETKVGLHYVPPRETRTFTVSVAVK